MSKTVWCAAFLAGIIALSGAAGAQEKAKAAPAAPADKAAAAQAKPEAPSVPWLVNCAATGDGDLRFLFRNCTL